MLVCNRVSTNTPAIHRWLGHEPRFRESFHFELVPKQVARKAGDAGPVWLRTEPA